LGPVLTLHAAPLALLALYYLTCVRRMEIGGGDDDGALNVMARAISLWIGAPLSAAGAIVALVAALGGTALGLWLLVRKGSSLWVFFGAILLLFAAIPLTALRPKALYERYFLVCLSFGLVLLALALGWLYRKGAWGKAIFAVALAGFLAGNALHTAWLLKVGRGHCVEVIQYIDRNATGEVASVAGNHDFRTSTMLLFYLPRASIHRTLLYVPRGKDETEIADWFIQDRREYAPVARYVSIRGRLYELATTFEMTSPRHPFCLSGWSWDVYRLAASPS
jgi:hypothetical protein